MLPPAATVAVAIPVPFSLFSFWSSRLFEATISILWTGRVGTIHQRHSARRLPPPETLSLPSSSRRQLDQRPTPPHTARNSQTIGLRSTPSLERIVINKSFNGPVCLPAWPAGVRPFGRATRTRRCRRLRLLYHRLGVDRRPPGRKTFRSRVPQSVWPRRSRSACRPPLKAGTSGSARCFRLSCF